MKKFIKVMKALSDPGRVKAIKMLQCKDMCVCELQNLLGLAQPTISKHLKVLEEAGLVESRKNKAWVDYRLATGEESVYAATLLAHLQEWLADDPGIRKLLAKAPLVDRMKLVKN